MSQQPEAVYFADRDYAHPIRRFGAFLVECLVFLLTFYLVLFAVVLSLRWTTLRGAATDQASFLNAVREQALSLKNIVLMVFLAVLAFYHVFARTTIGGTLGYRLVRVRLVDAAGGPPSVNVLVKRFLLALPTFMLAGLPYVVCFTAARRQAIHDRISGTWVVRRRATPAGEGRLAYRIKPFIVGAVTITDIEPAEAQAEESLNVPDA